MKSTIGRNLKTLRGFNKFTQEQIAQFLGIERSAYSNYESGLRDAPLEILEKCSDIYGCDLHLFFEEKELEKTDLLVCAFRVSDISDADMNEIAKFKNIVKNYIKINTLLAK